MLLKFIVFNGDTVTHPLLGMTVMRTLAKASIIIAVCTARDGHRLGLAKYGSFEIVPGFAYESYEFCTRVGAIQKKTLQTF